MPSQGRQRAGHHPQGYPPWRKCSGWQGMELGQCTEEEDELLHHSHQVSTLSLAKHWRVQRAEPSQAKPSQAKPSQDMISLLFSVTHQCLQNSSAPLEMLQSPSAGIRHCLFVLLGNPSACSIVTPSRELGNSLPANPCHNAFLRSGGERHIITPWRPLEAVLEVHDIFLLLCGWNNLDRKDLYVGEKYC